MEATNETGRGNRSDSRPIEAVPWWVNLVIVLAIVGLVIGITWGVLIRLGYLPE